MAEGEAEQRRREFSARAPELRAAAVVELLEQMARASDLSADEAEVLRHLAARAGYSFDGFHIPDFAALWGGAGDSYFPPVPLPTDRARNAAQFLRRRGVLRPEGGGVFVVVEALVPLVAPVAAPVAVKKPVKKSAAKKAPKKRAQ
jgi:hypothetical protein